MVERLKMEEREDEEEDGGERAMKHGYSENATVRVSDTSRIPIRARYAPIRIGYGKISILIFFLIFHFRIRLGYGTDTVRIRQGYF